MSTRKLPSGAILAAVLALSMGVLVGPAAAAGKKSNDPAQIARGAKAWVTQCTRCHNLRNVKDQTDGEWTVSVTHMRVRGNIPAQIARDIAAFLKASN